MPPRSRPRRGLQRPRPPSASRKNRVQGWNERTEQAFAAINGVSCGFATLCTGRRAGGVASRDAALLPRLGLRASRKVLVLVAAVVVRPFLPALQVHAVRLFASHRRATWRRAAPPRSRRNRATHRATSNGADRSEHNRMHLQALPAVLWSSWPLHQNRPRHLTMPPAPGGSHLCR